MKTFKKVTLGMLAAATLICGNGCVHGEAKEPAAATLAGVATELAIVEFGPISERADQSTESPLETALGGGRLANPADYPATFQAVLPLPKGYSLCTATAIGSRVLLTAAHCVVRADGIRVRLREKVIAGECAAIPSADPSGYDDRDFALCALQKELGLSKYERLDFSPYPKGTGLMLAGFGCTNPDLRSGADNRLREGEVWVREKRESSEPYYRVGRGAWLCPGDSGGAAYYSADWMTFKNARRVIVAVNSAVTAKEGKLHPDKVSLLSALAHADAKTFVTDWLSMRKLTACGAGEAESNCRAGP